MNIAEVVEFYARHWQKLVIATIILGSLYFLLSNWEYYSALNHCLTTFKALTITTTKCFRTPRNDTCHDIIEGSPYGWCNDDDNYGMLPGTSAGPFGTVCSQWIWKKRDCPPQQCKGNGPYGIGNQKPFQKWGWCADPGVSRAMIGKPCGPSDGKRCNNWIWNVKDCPENCQKDAPKCKKEPEDSEDCGDVCGEINGTKVPCPPKCTKPKHCANVCGVVKTKQNEATIIKCPPPGCQDQECICNN